MTETKTEAPVAPTLREIGELPADQRRAAIDKRFEILYPKGTVKP